MINQSLKGQSRCLGREHFNKENYYMFFLLNPKKSKVIIIVAFLEVTLSIDEQTCEGLFGLCIELS